MNALCRVALDERRFEGFWDPNHGVGQEFLLFRTCETLTPQFPIFRFSIVFNIFLLTNYDEIFTKMMGRGAHWTLESLTPKSRRGVFLFALLIVSLPEQADSFPFSLYITPTPDSQHLRAAMCFKSQCGTCGKPTWSGCGKHIDTVRDPRLALPLLHGSRRNACKPAKVAMRGLT